MTISLKRALALGALMAMSASGLAFADSEGPYATFDIKLESTAAASEVHPMVTAPITKDKVQFHIINNTGKPVFFARGQEQSYIPLVSNNTVTVDYAPGSEYMVVDGEGHTVAKWNLDNRMVGVPSVSSASQSQFEEWGSTLQQVIANQKVSYQESAKSEPHYYNSKPTSRTSDVIRGYW